MNAVSKMNNSFHPYIPNPLLIPQHDTLKTLFDNCHNLNDNLSSSSSEEANVNTNLNDQEIEIEDTIEALKSVEIEDKEGGPVNQDIIEEAVEAADVIWDTVATRTQALSVPNSFKRQLNRPF